jgi:hypothetical protein
LHRRCAAIKGIERAQETHHPPSCAQVNQCQAEHAWRPTAPDIREAEPRELIQDLRAVAARFALTTLSCGAQIRLVAAVRRRAEGLPAGRS